MRAPVGLCVVAMACGARSDLTVDRSSPHDADGSMDAPAAPASRCSSTLHDWAIPIGASSNPLLTLDTWSVDIDMATGRIAATVAGWPQASSCHSGPTAGNGGCAALVISPQGDILLERRFECAVNENIGAGAVVTTDGGLVLAALGLKGADFGAGSLAGDALVVARYDSTGTPVYVTALGKQASALSVAASRSGEAFAVLPCDTNIAVCAGQPGVALLRFTSLTPEIT